MKTRKHPRSYVEVELLVTTEELAVIHAALGAVFPNSLDHAMGRIDPDRALGRPDSADLWKQTGEVLESLGFQSSSIKLRMG